MSGATNIVGIADSARCRSAGNLVHGRFQATMRVTKGKGIDALLSAEREVGSCLCLNVATDDAFPDSGEGERSARRYQPYSNGSVVALASICGSQGGRFRAPCSITDPAMRAISRSGGRLGDHAFAEATPLNGVMLCATGLDASEDGRFWWWSASQCDGSRKPERGRATARFRRCAGVGAEAVAG